MESWLTLLLPSGTALGGNGRADGHDIGVDAHVKTDADADADAETEAEFPSRGNRSAKASCMPRPWSRRDNSSKGANASKAMYLKGGTTVGEGKEDVGASRSFRSSHSSHSLRPAPRRVWAVLKPHSGSFILRFSTSQDGDPSPRLPSFNFSDPTAAVTVRRAKSTATFPRSFELTSNTSPTLLLGAEDDNTFSTWLRCVSSALGACKMPHAAFPEAPQAASSARTALSATLTGTSTPTAQEVIAQFDVTRRELDARLAELRTLVSSSSGVGSIQALSTESVSVSLRSPSRPESSSFAGSRSATSVPQSLASGTGSGPESGTGTGAASGASAGAGAGAGAGGGSISGALDAAHQGSSLSLTGADSGTNSAGTLAGNASRADRIRGAASSLAAKADQLGDSLVEREEAVLEAAEKLESTLASEETMESIDQALAVVSDVTGIGIDVEVIAGLVSGLADLASSIPFMGSIVSSVSKIFDTYKSAKQNQRACAIFAKRVQDLSATLLEIGQACGGQPPPQLEPFGGLLDEGAQVINRFRQRGFLSRLLKGKSDALRFQEIDDELSNMISDMQLHVLGTSLSLQRQSFQEVAVANEAILRRLDSIGGADGVASDPIKLEEFARLVGASASDVKEELAVHFERLLASQASIEAKLDEGPHLLISNLGMRELWRTYFRASESIGVDSFFEALRDFLVARIKVSREAVDTLLSTYNIGLLKPLLDPNDDGSVSIVEASRAFNRRDLGLLDLLRSAVADASSFQKCSCLRPPVPFVGRVTQLEQVQNAFKHGCVRMQSGYRSATSEDVRCPPSGGVSPCRFVTVRAKEGFGKTAFVLQVLQTVRSDFEGHTYYCDVHSVPNIESAALHLASVLGVDIPPGSDVTSSLVTYIRQLSSPIFLAIDGGRCIEGMRSLVNALRLASHNLYLLLSLRTLAGIHDDVATAVYAVNVVLPTFSEASIDSFLRANSDASVASLVSHALPSARRFCRGSPFILKQLCSLPLAQQIKYLMPVIKRRSCMTCTSVLSAVQNKFDSLSQGRQMLILELTVFQACFTADAVAEVAFPELFGDASTTSLISGMLKDVGMQAPSRGDTIEYLQRRASVAVAPHALSNPFDEALRILDEDAVSDAGTDTKDLDEAGSLLDLDDGDDDDDDDNVDGAQAAETVATPATAGVAGAVPDIGRSRDGSEGHPDGGSGAGAGGQPSPVAPATPSTGRARRGSTFNPAQLNRVNPDVFDRRVADVVRHRSSVGDQMLSVIHQLDSLCEWGLLCKFSSGNGETRYYLPPLVHEVLVNHVLTRPEWAAFKASTLECAHGRWLKHFCKLIAKAGKMYLTSMVESAMHMLAREAGSVMEVVRRLSEPEKHVPPDALPNVFELMLCDRVLLQIVPAKDLRKMGTALLAFSSSSACWLFRPLASIFTARVHLSDLDCATAIPLTQEAMAAISARDCPSDHLDFCIILAKATLGQARIFQRKFAEGQALVQEAISGLEGFLSKPGLSPTVRIEKQVLRLALLTLLPEAVEGQGDTDGALRLAVECVTDLKALIGDQHPWFAEALHTLATQFAHRRRLIEAKEAYFSAYKLFQKANGKHDPRARDTAFALFRVSYALGHMTDAAWYLNDAGCVEDPNILAARYSIRDARRRARSRYSVSKGGERVELV